MTDRLTDTHGMKSSIAVGRISYIRCRPTNCRFCTDCPVPYAVVFRGPDIEHLMNPPDSAEDTETSTSPELEAVSLVVYNAMWVHLFD